MILQQNTEASLWGWDKPGTTVEVTTSWFGQKYSTKTGKDGKWAIKVQTPKASYTPLSITFDDGEKTTLNNVLAGEVWVCAGQSNMEMPVKGFGNCPVEVSVYLLATGNNKEKPFQKTGWILPGALVCTLAGMIASVIIVKIM